MGKKEDEKLIDSLKKYGFSENEAKRTMAALDRLLDCVIVAAKKIAREKHISMEVALEIVREKLEEDESD